MGTVLRIIDKFNITGHGIVYIVKPNKDTVIHMDEVFYDLAGNEFKVTGIEMSRKLLNSFDQDETTIGLLFQTVDGVQARGSILVSNTGEVNFIFCNHPLYSRKVDEDYEDEYEQASSKCPCALFSYEDLEKGKLTIFGQISGLTIYRGWMMKPEMYQEFYTQLEEQGIILINSPEEYNRYHLLPGWYNDFSKYTAQSVWEDSNDIDKAMQLTCELQGSYVVKDYVKSRKHEWYDACFIKDISDKVETRKIITNFVDRQADAFVGGIVLRKFIDLKSLGFHEKSGMPISEEYRVFIYAGQIVVIDHYWRSNGGVNLSSEESKWIDSLATKVRSNFVTIDLARKIDGSLVIMEFGDGQVSGLQDIKPVNFYLNLLEMISTEDFSKKVP